MRRISEYVATHLSENMDLAVLAGVAGFLVFHFAREFKQTAGVTPHFYLLQKRVQRAKEMLTRTDLSLSEIALAAGFSDQSHLARHFSSNGWIESQRISMVTPVAVLPYRIY